MNKRILLFLIIFLIFPYIVFSIKTFVIQETEKISLQSNATDPDTDNLVTSYSEPLDDNGEWQTDYGDAGEYTATITVSDGTESASQDVLIIVKKKEEAPVIGSSSPAQEELDIKEGETIYFNASATDANKDELGYEWLFDGKKAQEGPEFRYDSSYDSSGKHKVKVIVSDRAAKASREWDVNVGDADRVPVFEEIGNMVVNENQTIEIILKAEDP